MNEPTVAQKSPYVVEVEEGKYYTWCACGLSKTQPFCDLSHSGTGINPIAYKAEKTGTVYFCGCKNSKNKPLCDDTHLTL